MFVYLGGFHTGKRQNEGWRKLRGLESAGHGGR